MGYTPSFTPQYENGWEDLPLETTPITADALNNYDDAIENIEDYLASDDSQANIADAYDETATYVIGAYVIHNGTLYKCTTAISEAEEWDSTHWTSCIVTDEMGSGGGGSTISITPTISTGTKIADFEIDGTSGELYAPSGGGSANIWTGTQAEYEAQASQIADGTLVTITDDEQEVVDGGTIYSEEEQVIGLWTDKKPLYQRTYNVTFSSDAYAITIPSEIDIKTIIGGVDSANKTDFIHIGYGGGSSDSVQAYRTDATTLRFQNKYYSQRPNGEITLQYTKTTDAPIDVVVGKRTMYIASSDCYSTEEKEVGCNVDGKPLYQKTLHATNVALSANGRTVVYSISDLTSLAIDNVVGEVSGYAIFGSGDANKIDIPYAIANSNGSIGAYYDNGYGICIHRLGNALTLNDLYLTLQYTKTTDTAGSGQYTPASGKAVHYSTDEQVIGTWTDGKPLYQITKTLTSGIAINIYGNIDLPSGIVVRDIKGYIYRNNYESVDMFNGYINNGQLFITVRSGDIQYMITNVFSDIEELDITVQYTKTTD